MKKNGKLNGAQIGDKTADQVVAVIKGLFSIPERRVPRRRKESVEKKEVVRSLEEWQGDFGELQSLRNFLHVL